MGTGQQQREASQTRQVRQQLESGVRQVLHLLLASALVGPPEGVRHGVRAKAHPREAA